MDLETTISSVAESVSENVQYVIQGASDYIPEEICSMIRHAYIYFPTEIKPADSFQFILYLALCCLVPGVLSRIVLGRRSSLNRSLSAAMAIAFVYAATVLIYVFNPWQLQAYLTPLPFVSFSGDYLILFPIADLELSAMCQQILSLIILAFLVNLLDVLIPHSDNPIIWFVMRFVCVLLSMGLHYLISSQIHAHIGDIFLEYASVILLFLLAFMLFSGILSLILGLVIAVANPFLGAMYTFFFSSVIGKQLSKAVFTSFILCAVFYALDLMGYTVICISSGALITFLPLCAVLLLLWYLIGHVL